MSRPSVRVIVLYEDRAHDSFLRRLFKHLKLHPVRYEKCRNSVGVLQRLDTEVNSLRSQRHQHNLGLIVCIDADEKGLAGRIAELNGRTHRLAAERIAFVVPALEIENWYVHLCCPAARPIDETRDYKSSPEWRALEKDLGRASRQAVEAWPPDPERVDPPSISAARNELTLVG